MSPEEVLPLFHSQIYAINNLHLSDQEWPVLEVLERASIRSDGLYLCYNALAVYLFVGKQCDPYYLT